MASQWSHILSGKEIVSYHAKTAELDARFAREQREFYERQTALELRSLASGSWFANDPDGYQLARSYLAALAEAA